MSTFGSDYLDSYYNTRWFDLHEQTDKNSIIYYNTAGNNTVSDALIVAIAVHSGDEIVGFIIFDINDYILKNMLTFTHNTDTVSVLADTEGNILYSTNAELTGKSISDIEKKSGFRSEAAASYIFATFSINGAGTMPNSSIMSIVFGAILLSFTLAAVIALYFAFQFYKSIFSLYTAFATADVYSKKANNEISQIISSVMKVVEQNEKFEKELNEKVISLRKSQSIALQTQLNPHFLFNTLSMINLMAINITKTDNDVSRVIMLLSELLRESLNTQEYMVSLKTELEYVEKFIEIEKIKHNNNFTVTYDISDETKECKVIKFMLQPIVENAFEHGTHRVKGREKYVVIRTYTESGKLIVSVKNNGEEIPASKLAQLQKRLKTDIIPEDKHIGMFNVNSRIKIVFGPQYGCEINCKNAETEVKLILPFE
jgi:sensor histidine kinase YesM